MFQDDDKGQYAVVINDEEQYSIWPEIREIPSGWRRTGFNGTKDACVTHIDEVWTDMRPASLRRAMAEGEGTTVRSGHEQ
ncbi:MbtH family NRPS accessory protein [Streptomyces sp. NPDC005438]|uniref:MbtH family protein n=1 Tax=Streptomyces sp. NPDC005438 TaxID=3156880 RepID=UPI0033BCCD31